MPTRVLRLPLVFACVALAAGGVGCKPSAAPAGSVSCHIANQQLCDELPAPPPGDDAALAVTCSSGSGVLARPAACPRAAFVGKCTTGTGPTERIRRQYTGIDVAYSQDFCANVAHGAWSTAF